MPVVDDQGPVTGEGALPEAEETVDPVLALNAEVVLWKERAERQKAKVQASELARQAAQDELDALSSEIGQLREQNGVLEAQNQSFLDREEEMSLRDAQSKELIREAGQLRKRWMSRPISEYIQELEGQVAFYRPGYPPQPPVLPESDEQPAEDLPSGTDEAATPPGGLSDDDS
jgi:hypothetical protein